MAKAGSKNSVVIVVAIVLAVIAAFVYHSDEQQTSQPYEARRLLGALEIEQIGSVAIETGATSVTLTRRSPEEWVIDQRAGYPVDAQKLRQHVLDLVEMEAVDRLTENPDLYGSLGVGPPSGDGQGGAGRHRRQRVGHGLPGGDASGLGSGWHDRHGRRAGPVLPAGARSSGLPEPQSAHAGHRSQAVAGPHTGQDSGRRPAADRGQAPRRGEHRELRDGGRRRRDAADGDHAAPRGCARGRRRRGRSRAH